MRVKEVNILKYSDIFGDNKFKNFEHSGIECFTSDLARVLGVEFDPGSGFGTYYIDDVRSSSKGKNITRSRISNTGDIKTSNPNKSAGVRITIAKSDIEDFDGTELSIEYPLISIGPMISETFDKMFANESRLIYKTGRVYDIGYHIYEEYELFENRFIKMQAKNSGIVLTDGSSIKKDDNVYLKVEKIPFSYDSESETFYSDFILFPTEFDRSNVEYSKSALKTYLNNNFIKTINDELPRVQEGHLFNKKETINNRYNFDYSDITEEEIIEICFNAGVAVFLHGKPGSGKTERVLALDENLELVDFGCTSSDGFTGIVAKDFNSKDLFLYEPYWYKSICEKCEKEPELLHILFLEELPNAKSDIQKVAFEVTLNKTLTNSGFRLHLPDNCIVCGAGNETSDSKSANQMSAPLFSRFAHVYIETDSNAWLNWAVKRKRQGKKLLYKKREDYGIHPAIIDFIKVKGDSVLNTPYNGKTPNADPRKWTMASKALYESNNPNVLRAFVGKEITEEFIKFTKLNLITIKDVLEDRVTPNDVSYDPTVRWYTTMCLSTVSDEYVDKVREFVCGLGKEYLAMFDYEWSKDNDERIMKIYSENLPRQTRKLTYE